jgi:PHS family inorganic phosphate transporter-like MFS transporter
MAPLNTERQSGLLVKQHHHGAGGWRPTASMATTKLDHSSFYQLLLKQPDPPAPALKFPVMNKFLVRGIGFFNDAYDLFVMNVVNVVLTEQYGREVYTSYVRSWVSAGALIGAIFGQLLFGYLGDVFGRIVNMIATCVLLIVGGILCTVSFGGSPSGTLWFLVAARIILGVGIGGEYPLAVSSSAEDSTSSADRNKRVAMTFSLQGAGQVFAAILGNLLVQALADGEAGENSDARLETVWRLLFGIGCLPAAVICYYRITAEETEAYKAVQERAAGVTRVGAEKKARLSFILRHYGVSLIGTAGTWFLFDIIYYAQTSSRPASCPSSASATRRFSKSR